jgi:ABC-type uncharacterized transport system ATPase component
VKYWIASCNVVPVKILYDSKLLFAGKSTLLKMIAGTLVEDSNCLAGGTVAVNGIERGTKGVVWSNLAAYIDQIDRLHARLTVSETLEFAWRCRSGGTHYKHFFGRDEEAKKAIEDADKDLFSSTESWKVWGSLELGTHL